MGTLGRARASHYWMMDDDFGNDSIRSVMTKNRYMSITSNLTFASRGTPGGWAKIEWLDGVLRIQCRTATGITQSMAVDESMFKVLSKYCPWIQFMPRKPIIKRGASQSCHYHVHTLTPCMIMSSYVHPHMCIFLLTGVKAFVLALSTGFQRDWHVYRGREDPLRGPNYVYRLIYDTLLGGPLWDFRNCTVYCDAYFTSIKLFRDLWEKRGIGAVGPINSAKPNKGAGPNSWPNQKFKKSDVRYLSRGWDKAAFQKLGRNGVMQAITWLDNKFVKLLCTMHITNGKETVLRWVRCVGTCWVSCVGTSCWVRCVGIHNIMCEHSHVIHTYTHVCTRMDQSCARKMHTYMHVYTQVEQSCARKNTSRMSACCRQIQGRHGSCRSHRQRCGTFPFAIKEMHPALPPRVLFVVHGVHLA